MRVQPKTWPTGTLEARCRPCNSAAKSAKISGLKATSKPGRTLEEVTYGERRVLLCRAHAGIAHNSGVKTFEGLRELYTEQHGARSYVPRRARTVSVAAKKKSRSPGRRIGDSG